VLAFDQTSGEAKGSINLYTAKNDPGGAWAVNTASWSPDSSKLAVVLQDSAWDKIWIISSKGGKPQQLTKGIGEDENPIYSPDGKWMVFTSNRDLAEERHLWIVSSSGGVPRRLTHLSGNELAPRWSPEGTKSTFLAAQPCMDRRVTWRRLPQQRKRIPWKQ